MLGRRVNRRDCGPPNRRARGMLWGQPDWPGGAVWGVCVGGATRGRVGSRRGTTRSARIRCRRPRRSCEGRPCPPSSARRGGRWRRGGGGGASLLVFTRVAQTDTTKNLHGRGDCGYQRRLGELWSAVAARTRPCLRQARDGLPSSSQDVRRFVNSAR